MISLSRLSEMIVFLFIEGVYMLLIGLILKRDMSAITITFGDQAENHKGMQIIGKMAEKGFTLDDLRSAQAKFQKQGYRTELVDLCPFAETPVEPAALLVIRKGADCLLQRQDKTRQELFDELRQLDWDSKAFMYGRVVDKHARHNLCFHEEEQAPDYETGKGRVVAWKTVPLLDIARKELTRFIENAEDLAAEGNYYYSVEKCGIGFHGDAERRKVIAIRLCNGKCPPLHYQWFLRGKPIGNRATIELGDGDLYIMSEKAVGTDWRKKVLPTLRHATGCAKFTTI